LHAQDRERSHIARELHDDVSQQLALIEMDVKLLGSGSGSGSGGELLERVQAVGRSVRDLSHRLPRRCCGSSGSSPR
jgi:signal transduction histidine kinase